jgi:hypothetical protein
MTSASATANAPRREDGARLPIAAAALALCVIALALYGAGALDWARGYAIYHGHLAVSGRLEGHDFNLPPIALRCAGCHEAGAGAVAPEAGAFDLSHLTDARSRRGGPAAAYTLESFCKVVTAGLDPALVMVDRTMPRFNMSAAECRALWTFLRFR